MVDPQKRDNGLSASEVISELGLNPTMQTEDVLVVCGLIGKYLQQVKASDRERVSAMLINVAKATDLTPEQRHMLIGVVTHWNTFDSSFWKTQRHNTPPKS